MPHQHVLGIAHAPQGIVDGVLPQRRLLPTLAAVGGEYQAPVTGQASQRVQDAHGLP